MDFTELNDNEIEELYKSHLNDSNEKYLKRYNTSKVIHTLKNNILKAEKNIEELLQFASQKNCKLISDKSYEIKKNLSKSQRLLDKIINENTFKIEDLKNVSWENVDVIFDYQGESIVITLPEILPRRIKINAQTKEVEHFYNEPKWKKSYYKAFQKEFMHGKYMIFDKKVRITFTHYIGTDLSFIPDVDNIDYKPIIDIIADFLLVDDSYNYMCYSVNIIKADIDTSYTSILIEALYR